MRTLLATLLLLALSLDARACDCFAPELRAKTAQDALDLARVAVYGRVVAVGLAGNTKVLVLESFKGPPAGATIDVVADTGQCAPRSSSVGEEALVLSFGDTTTACDKHSPEHYLLPAFRSISAKAP